MQIVGKIIAKGKKLDRLRLFYVKKYQTGLPVERKIWKIVAKKKIIVIIPSLSSY